MGAVDFAPRADTRGAAAAGTRTQVREGADRDVVFQDRAVEDRGQDGAAVTDLAVVNDRVWTDPAFLANDRGAGEMGVGEDGGIGGDADGGLDVGGIGVLESDAGS